MAGTPGVDRMIALDARNDLDGTALMIEALDVVITVDTSIAHLAAALGRPVWVMLAYAADWRWGYGERTSWYPTVRLFRQSTPGDWASVVRDIDSALTERRLSI
jgi:ADP-heptose:LPS heptosyltransferase